MQTPDHRAERLFQKFGQMRAAGNVERKIDPEIVLPDIGGQQSVQRTEIAVDKYLRDSAMRRDGIDPEFLETIPADHLAHRFQHTLFGNIPVTLGIVVLRHMLLFGNKYMSFFPESCNFLGIFTYSA